MADLSLLIIIELLLLLLLARVLLGELAGGRGSMNFLTVVIEHSLFSMPFFCSVRRADVVHWSIVWG